jgi:hypothetical protein
MCSDQDYRQHPYVWIDHGPRHMYANSVWLWKAIKGDRISVRVSCDFDSKEEAVDTRTACSVTLSVSGGWTPSPMCAWASCWAL